MIVGFVFLVFVVVYMGVVLCDLLGCYVSFWSYVIVVLIVFYGCCFLFGFGVVIIFFFLFFVGVMEEEDEEVWVFLVGGFDEVDRGVLVVFGVLLVFCDFSCLVYWFLVLLLMCFFGFGSYFCYDNFVVF